MRLHSTRSDIGTRWALLVFFGFACGLMNLTVQAQSPPDANDAFEMPDALKEMLPTLTADRLRSAAQFVEAVPTTKATEEAARVVWAIRRLPKGLDQPTELKNPDDVTAPVGENRVRAWQGSGRAVGVEAVRIPDALGEVIEMSRLFRVRMETQDGEVWLVVAEVPEIWATVGKELHEPIEVSGLRLDSGLPPDTGNGAIVFGAGVRWIIRPESLAATDSPWPIGWRLLGSRGFDCGLLSGVVKRTRSPLVADDYPAFYGMLEAANAIGDNRTDATVPQPTRLDTAALLRSSREQIGQWLRLDMETTRVSRVVVSDPKLRARLGRDAYWQIDGFGNLDRVRIELEGGEDAGGENLIFEDRFPLSVAIGSLPEWLEDRMRKSVVGGGRVDVGMVTEPVTVDAFFYRLWSYESEFATSRGGRQVAPLLIATTIESRSAGLAASAGQVQSLGWILAFVVIGSILLTSVVLWRVGRRDAAVKARRKAADAS